MSIGARFPSVLAAAGRGEDWAWAEIYRDLSPAMLGYLFGRGAAEPEDLLGECFVHIVRNLGLFDGDEKAFRSWVFTIAHNRMVEHWRRHQRGSTHAIGEDELVRRVNDASSPAQPDQALLQRAALIEILDQISPLQRDVLLLRVVNQFTIRETASILGKSEGAIKVLQSRALKALRRAWESRSLSTSSGAELSPYRSRHARQSDPAWAGPLC